MKTKRRPPYIAGLWGALLAVGLTACAGGAVEPGLRAGLNDARRGRWDDALASWKDNVQAGRGSAALHNNLAVACEQQGLREEAALEYEAALAAAPDNLYIQKNRDRFSGSPDKAEDPGDVLAAEGRAGVERVVIMARLPALLAPRGYSAIVIAGFREDGTVPDFDAAGPAADWAATEVRRFSNGDVIRPRDAPGRALRPDDEAGWRAVGAAFGRALIVTGSVRLDRAVEKSIRETDIPKDGPFKAANRGLATRTRFSFFLGLDLIAAETGQVRLHKDIRKTMQYDSVWESTDIALQAMLVEARNDIAAVFSGEEKKQTRYLLTR